MEKLIALFGMLTVGFLPLPAGADVLEFACSWNDDTGIKITVDTTELTATRDDGGSDYKVLNITDKAVFLQLNMPGWYLVTVQVLERPSGGWHDVIVYDDGQVSAIEGGVCIESN